MAFFVDSGLASEAAIAVPEQILNYVGIPIPETEKLPENLGDLGGGGFPVGFFAIETLGLGPLVQKNYMGVCGPLIFRTGRRSLFSE